MNPLGEITASPPMEKPQDPVKESTAVDSPEPPKKTCALKDALPASVIPLIQANPKNETIRNLMLAHLKVPVPVECDTFEKVKDWIEHNVKVEAPEDPISRQYRIQQEEAERRARNSIRLEVTVEATERGSARYSQDLRGEGNIPFERDRLVRLASEADNDDDLFERIEAFMEEEGPSNYISLDNVGEARVYDYEADYDEEQTNVVTLKQEAKDAIKAALRAADPELYRSLFGE